MSNSWCPVDYSPARLLCHGISQTRITGVDCHLLLQGIFPTQELNLHILHWQADSLPLSHQESPTNIHRGNNNDRDFPGGPVVKNLPSNAGYVGSKSDQGTKIPLAMKQHHKYCANKFKIQKYTSLEFQKTRKSDYQLFSKQTSEGILGINTCL